MGIFDYYIEKRAKAEKQESNGLLEKLADIEHQQWVEWSKAVAPEVSKERQERWSKLWVPYAELSEEMKEEDRKYARKVMKVTISMT